MEGITVHRRGQRKQAAAIARTIERMANVAPRSKPPMVTRVELVTKTPDGHIVAAGTGILRHPARFAR
jgi:hypothetical protein